jgi:hypothetical protein
VYRQALGPTQPPIQWVPGALSLGAKRPRREADHSPPSSAEVKNAWSYTPIPPVRLHGVVLNQSTGTTLPFFFTYMSMYTPGLCFLQQIMPNTYILPKRPCAGLIPPAKESYQMSNGAKKLNQDPRMAGHCRSPMLRAERKRNK